MPVIIKWPGHTKPGSVSHEPVISTDFYPTILAATGQNRCDRINTSMAGASSPF